MDVGEDRHFDSVRTPVHVKSGKEPPTRPAGSTAALSIESRWHLTEIRIRRCRDIVESSGGVSSAVRVRAFPGAGMHGTE